MDAECDIFEEVEFLDVSANSVADDSLEALLATWEMPPFILDQCERYKLTKSHLQRLQNEDISTLIPDEHLALRIEFKYALQLWKQKSAIVRLFYRLKPRDDTASFNSNLAVKQKQQLQMRRDSKI